jgi:hypothetical protein
MERGLGASQLVLEPRFVDARQEAVTLVLGIGREVGVREGMVPHLMTLEYGSADDHRVTFDETTRNEERDLEIQFLLEIEEFGGPIG